MSQITLNVSLKSLPRLEKIPTLSESDSHSKIACDFVDASSFPRSRRNSSSESPMSSSLITSETASKRSKETQFADHQFFEQAINDVTLPPLYTLFPSEVPRAEFEPADDERDVLKLGESKDYGDDSEVFKDSDLSTLSNISQWDNVCSACSSITDDAAYEPCDKSIVEKAEISSDIEQFPSKSDCRQCKRRKIRHVSHLAKGKSNRRTMSECLVGNYHQFEYEYGEPCDLTLPGSNLEFPICDKNVACKIEENFSSFNELNSYRRAFSDDLINQLTDEIPLNKFNGNENINCDSKPAEENNNCLESEESRKLSSLLPADSFRSKSLGLKRFFKKANQEIKPQHLLGSFEENLLKNRFHPQTTVDGYKALLGASGNFCPSQLTIPALTKFYEFQGKHNNITTPYVVSHSMHLNHDYDN